MPNVTLMPHQLTALEKMHDGCVLVGGVGSGKTFAAIQYFWDHHREKDLYVFTTARKRDDLDWQDTAILYGVGRDRLVRDDGIIYAGKIVVDSWNNITKYKDIENSFIIADEQRLVGSGTWSKAFIFMAKKNPWIMLSATPGDTWMDYATLFIANGFYKNITSFKREHVIYSPYTKFPKIDRYIGTSKLQDLEKRIVVEMPFERHTTRHIQTHYMDYDTEKLDRIIKDRWHIYEERPLNDMAEMLSCMKRLVNTDGSRVELIRDLMDRYGRLIIFYNFDYELEILRGLVGSGEPEEGTDGFVSAEWNGHRHQPVPEGDKWVYLVQYTAGAEAWNCVRTDRIVFYSLQYSYKVFEQAQGRIDRLNTPYTDLYYDVLTSKSPIDQAIWRSLQGKKSFNERKFLEKYSK